MLSFVDVQKPPSGYPWSSLWKLQRTSRLLVSDALVAGWACGTRLYPIDIDGMLNEQSSLPQSSASSVNFVSRGVSASLEIGPSLCWKKKVTVCLKTPAAAQSF